MEGLLLPAVVVDWAFQGATVAEKELDEYGCGGLVLPETGLLFLRGATITVIAARQYRTVVDFRTQLTPGA